jgi:DivIVA domain-containing protein
MMTAAEIRSQRFGVQLRGFNSEEVLAFLGEVAEAYEDLQKMNIALAHAAREAQVIRPPEVVRGAEAQAESRSKTAEEKATPPSSPIVLRAVALQEVEALLHDARAQAQALIDGARERAAAALADVEAVRAQQRREAEDLVAEATSRAESRIVAAREEETAIRDEIERLSQRRLQIVDDVRATLDTYQEWLETVDPRGRVQGRRKALGTSNGGGEGVGFSDEARAG